LGAKAINHALYLDWVPNVEQAFSQMQLAGQWEMFRTPIARDSATLKTLAICADHLSRVAPEPNVPDEDLTKLREQVWNLHDEILAARVDPELQLFLLKHVREIELAIDTYQIQGAPGLSRAVGAAMAETASRPEISGKLSQGVGRRFVAIVGIVLNLTTWGGNVARIEERVTYWLTEGASVTTEEIPAVPPAPTPPILDGRVIEDKKDDTRD
jgi:hypothetical protein